MSTKIEEVRAINEAQKAYKWNIFLPNLSIANLNSRLNQVFGQVTTESSNGTLFERAIDSQSSALLNGTRNRINQAAQFFNPSMQVEEVQGLPFAGVDREPFYEAGRNTYFPSLEDTSSFSVVFYQDASDKIPSYINEWKRKIVNQDGTKNLPSNYKLPITVQLLNGQNQVTFEIIAVGCFPTLTTGYNLGNQSENLKFTQEFSVDRIDYGPVFDIRGAVKQDLQDRLLSKTAEQIENDSNFNFLNNF